MSVRSSLPARRTVLTGAVVCALAASITAVPVVAALGSPGSAAVDAPVVAAPAVRTAVLPLATPALPASYTRQALRWQKCFDPANPPQGLPRTVLALQCTVFRAPRDWHKPSASQSVQIFATRLPATRRPARGATFTNPGGPGAEGAFLPVSLLLAKRTALLASQDVYGLDPRGVGLSTNVTCGPVPKQRAYDPRNRSAANLKRILDQTQALARMCDARGGLLLDSLTTPNAVRDLDLLRRLIKQPKINFIGYSGGSWLGAHYATTFPRQTGRFVLDSVADVTTTWQKGISALQPRGFERRFRLDFLAWAARHNSVYGLGATPEAVRTSYEALRAALAARPVEVQPGVTVNGAVLDQAISGAMYSKRRFAILASTLADLRTSTGATASPASAAGRAAEEALEQLAANPALREAALEESGAVPPAASTGLDPETAAFYAYSCNDTAWRDTRSTLISSSAAQGRRYPLVGWGTVEQPCAFWKRPAVPLATITGRGLPPMLLVQSDRDPATPIEGARRTASRLASSRLLLVRGEGDHGIYASGNACVDRVVERWITAGILPARGAACAGTAMPPPVRGTGASPDLAAQTAASPLSRTAQLARRWGSTVGATVR